MILVPGCVHHHALRVRIEYKNNLVIAQGDYIFEIGVFRCFLLSSKISILQL